MNIENIDDNKKKSITLKEFFEKQPPGKIIEIDDISEIADRFGSLRLKTPNIELYCNNAECQGMRFFTPASDSNAKSISKSKANNNNFISYICRNCSKNEKIFAVFSSFNSEDDKWYAMKYGELPFFGPPTPPRTYKLIGGEQSLFIKGMRCENQGLGIGAFVYYRRVIENQKGRIFDEILKVVKKINPDNEVIEELERAKKETQFTKAVDSIKHALPQALFINGYNPLTLLHSALSEGVHAHDDAGCLELAADVRTVLFEFAERLGEALKEEATLNSAVNRLANKSKKTKRKKELV
ncbi:MAG: hypothetical protein WA987_05875 [Cellvibrio sp.]